MNRPLSRPRRRRLNQTRAARRAWLASIWRAYDAFVGYGKTPWNFDGNCEVAPMLRLWEKNQRRAKIGLPPVEPR